MKKIIFILILILLTGCISTGSKGYIKTKDGATKTFNDAYVITFSKEIMVVEKQSEMLFDKKNIRAIHIEAENYR